MHSNDFFLAFKLCSVLKSACNPFAVKITPLKVSFHRHKDQRDVTVWEAGPPLHSHFCHMSDFTFKLCRSEAKELNLNTELHNRYTIQ